MRIGKGWERGGGIEHSFEKKNQRDFDFKICEIG